MANYKKEKFYTTEGNNEKFNLKEVTGEIVTIKGIRFGLSKTKAGYMATELTTGLGVAEAKNRKETVAKVEEVADKVDKARQDPRLEKVKAAIREKMNPETPVVTAAKETKTDVPVPAKETKKATKKAPAKKEEKKEETTMAKAAAKEVAQETKAPVTVEMQVGKVTKNTIRFEEVVESEFTNPKIGTLYVPKGTLGEIGYAEGMSIMVTIQPKVLDIQTK